MSTWNAVHLRDEVPVDFRPAVEGEAPVRRMGAWWEIALPRVQSGEASARELSSKVDGEVIWTLIQTNAGVLAVVCFERGQLIRRLEYGDRSWRRVEGDPRAWESELFSEDALKDALEGGDEEAVDEEAVRSAFAAKTLTAGERFPRPREWDSMWNALGVSGAEWTAARQSGAAGVLHGSKTLPVTIWSRALLLAGASSIAVAVTMTGDARAVLGAIAGPLVALGLAAAMLRRLNVGAGSSDGDAPRPERCSFRSLGLALSRTAWTIPSHGVRSFSEPMQLLRRAAAAFVELATACLRIGSLAPPHAPAWRSRDWREHRIARADRVLGARARPRWSSSDEGHLESLQRSDRARRGDLARVCDDECIAPLFHLPRWPDALGSHALLVNRAPTSRLRSRSRRAARAAARRGFLA